MKSFFDFLRLKVTILTLKSADPTAMRFELGWKQRVVTGDVVIGFFIVWSRNIIFQHFKLELKNPRARELQEDPRANFFPFGAHFDTKIDNLTSMLTSMRSHLLSLTCCQTKTLLSWLDVRILLSAVQSTPATVWV